MISNSGHDENGKYAGGNAGDQTGTEWQIIPWYNRPWNYVLRHPNAAVREKLADLGEKAAKNNCVGYDQNQRYTYWEELQKVMYDPSKITKNCEADCSAGVIANIKAAGYLLGLTALKNINASYTGNLRAGAKAAGFEVLTTSKYLTSDAYLLRGDLLLYEGHHVATNLTDGIKVSAADVSLSKMVCIKRGQEWLNRYYATLIKKYRGDILVTDGVYGPKTRAAALLVWKDLMNRKYDYNLHPGNINFGVSCRSAASKATVKKGTTGTMVVIAKTLLAAKGYYVGSMSNYCDDAMMLAIGNYRNSAGLNGTVACDADMWYKLFN